MSRSRFYRSFGGGSISAGLWGATVQPQSGGGGGGGHTYGAELWPQPVFAASTGLTLFVCTISGGILTFPAGSAPSCTASIAGLSTGDTLHASITLASAVNGGDITLKCSTGIGSVVIGTIPAGSPAGTYTFDKVVGSAHTSLVINGATGAGDTTFSAYSVKKQLT